MNNILISLYKQRWVLTYTQNVETKTLCDRFTDQLVRKAVESNMAAQAEATLFFILSDTKQNIQILLHVRRITRGKNIGQRKTHSHSDASKHQRPSVHSADVKPISYIHYEFGSQSLQWG